MAEGPTTEHLRREAQKIVCHNDGVPAEVMPPMVQVALESSNVDVDELTQPEYDVVFWQTQNQLEDLLKEIR